MTHEYSLSLSVVMLCVIIHVSRVKSIALEERMALCALAQQNPILHWNCTDPDPCNHFVGITCIGDDVSELNISFLSGTIPTLLGQLTYLRQLDLSNTKLSGTIPSQLGMLNITDLSLVNTELCGCFPTSWQLRKWDHCAVDVPHDCNCTLKYCANITCGSPCPFDLSTPTGCYPESTKPGICRLYNITADPGYTYYDNLCLQPGTKCYAPFSTVCYPPFSKPGICQSNTTLCSEGKYFAGYCSNPSDDVQCCAKPIGTKVCTPVGTAPGICVNPIIDTVCENGAFYPGYCQNESQNTQCCAPYNTECFPVTTNPGVCQDISLDCPGGFYYPNHCTSPNQNIQCCAVPLQPPTMPSDASDCIKGNWNPLCDMMGLCSNVCTADFLDGGQMSCSGLQNMHCCIPKNCAWSTWTDWGNCSQSCGLGTKFRRRVEQNCSPLSTEIQSQDCLLDNCNHLNGCQPFFTDIYAMYVDTNITLDTPLIVWQENIEPIQFGVRLNFHFVIYIDIKTNFVCSGGCIDGKFLEFVQQKIKFPFLATFELRGWSLLKNLVTLEVPYLNIMAWASEELPYLYDDNTDIDEILVYAENQTALWGCLIGTQKRDSSDSDYTMIIDNGSVVSVPQFQITSSSTQCHTNSTLTSLRCICDPGENCSFIDLILGTNNTYANAICHPNDCQAVQPGQDIIVAVLNVNVEYFDDEMLANVKKNLAGLLEIPLYSVRCTGFDEETSSSTKLYFQLYLPDILATEKVNEANQIQLSDNPKIPQLNNIFVIPGPPLPISPVQSPDHVKTTSQVPLGLILGLTLGISISVVVVASVLLWWCSRIETEDVEQIVIKMPTVSSSGSL